MTHQAYHEYGEGLVEFSDLPSSQELSTGWKHENPDTYRGAPFRRYLKKGTRGGGVAELVECPDGLLQQAHLQRSWQRSFPKIWAWWIDASERRPYRWYDRVFLKSDWKRRSTETNYEVVG